MDYTVDKINNYLKKNISSAKYKHTLGCAKTALKLALKYNVEGNKVLLASLLHDTGRSIKIKDMPKYVKKYKVKAPGIKGILKNNPFLLHSFISSDIAKRKFGIKNKTVLKAIEEHTLGNIRMSDVSKIVYISDATAPDRRFPYVGKLRKLSSKNLDEALKFALGEKIKFVIKKNQWVHPRAVMAWNKCLETK